MKVTRPQIINNAFPVVTVTFSKLRQYGARDVTVSLFRRIFRANLAQDGQIFYLASICLVSPSK